MERKKVKLELEICNCEDCPYYREEVESFRDWDYNITGAFCFLTDLYVDGISIDKSCPLKEV